MSVSIDVNSSFITIYYNEREQRGYYYEYLSTVLISDLINGFCNSQFLHFDFVKIRWSSTWKGI